jgi:hypothetical protein
MRKESPGLSRSWTSIRYGARLVLGQRSNRGVIGSGVSCNEEEFAGPLGREGDSSYGHRIDGGKHA